MVLGAVAHAEIASVGAFGPASGLVARAAEHLVLVSGGLDPYAVIVVEAGHAADPAGYRAGLAAYANGGVNGVSGLDHPVCSGGRPRRGALARGSGAESRGARNAASGHDAAPTVVGAVPGTTAASDQACSYNVLAPASRGRNCPSEMGDRRVGTCLPCEDRPTRPKTTAHQSP